MIDLDRLIARRQLDDWRDRHTLLAAAVLNRAARDLCDRVTRDLAAASVVRRTEAHLRYSHMISTSVVPTVRSEADSLTRQLFNDAKRELTALGYHSVQWGVELMILADATVARTRQLAPRLQRLIVAMLINGDGGRPSVLDQVQVAYASTVTQLRQTA